MCGGIGWGCVSAAYVRVLAKWLLWPRYQEAYEHDAGWVEEVLFYICTHSLTHTHTQRDIKLICVTLNNLKLHLHPSHFLTHTPSPKWPNDHEKGLWLLYFYYHHARTYNHDYLSRLQETTADCFIGFFCGFVYIFTLFILVQYISELLRVLFPHTQSFIVSLWSLFFFFFGTKFS